MTDPLEGMRRITVARAAAIRVRPARIIRTRSQAVTERFDFDTDAAAAEWVAELRNHRTK